MEERSKLLAPVKKIFLGVIVYVIAGMVYSIVAPMESLDEESVGAIVSVYCSLTALAIGYALALVGTVDFQKEVSDSAKKAVYLIKTGFIIFIVAAIFEMIGEVREMKPDIIITVGAITTIVLNIAAPIVFLIGYCNLKKENFFNKEIRKGFSILFSASLVMLVGYLLRLTGSVLSKGCEDVSSVYCIIVIVLWAVFIFAGFIMTLLGWNKVKRGAVKSY
jgi:hypothetical protein